MTIVISTSMDIITYIWAQNRLKNRIGIIGADPGGVNTIIGLLLARNIRSVTAYIPITSRHLFDDYSLLHITYVDDWRNLIDLSDWIILSASWTDKTFLNAIASANKKGIPTWLVLDSWYDYAERFKFSTRKLNQLPTKFVVSDTLAEKILRDRLKLSQDQVLIDKNLQFKYFLHHAEYIADKPHEETALILGSPLTAAKSHGMVEASALQFTEQDIVAACIEVLSELNINSVIRPHPSQVQNEYAEFASSPLVEISANKDLGVDLSRATIVIGYCSAALAIASIVGRKSICFGMSRSKDFFKWESYGVYDYYQIHWAGSQSDLREYLI